jgi:type III pantothenate kinase
MKTLYLDVGNTRLKWGLSNQSDSFSQTGHCLTQDSDNLQAILTEHSLDHVVGVCVAPPHRQTQITTHIHSLTQVNTQWLISPTHTGDLINTYHQPDQLGPDRWAALLGAWSQKKAPTIVLTLGTATTIDSIDGQGHFLGGIILPGLTLLQKTLHQNTARLPRFELTSFPKPLTWPKKTETAIHQGALFATLGAYRLIYDRLKKETNRTPLTWLTGGQGPLLQEFLQPPFQYEPILNLLGLRFWYQNLKIG